MKVYESDQEQLKALTKWWQQNKKSTLSLMFAILLAGTAYNLYKSNKASSSQIAAATYYNIIASVANNDINLAKSQISSLKDEHASSSYAALSSLILAKILVDEKSYPDAITQLIWVISHGDKYLHDLAYVRIARINLELNKPSLALTNLTTVTHKFQLAEKNIVEGDAYLQLKNTNKAKQAYKIAMQNADKNKLYELWELANMKYNSLGNA
jgi:predicted negative regulator of RcsB-dependent stress response